MEKIYYKAKIVELNKNIYFNIGDLKHFGFDKMADEFLKFLYTLEKNIKDEFINQLGETDNNTIISLSSPTIKEIKNIINYVFKSIYESKCKDNDEIIFEVIITKTGDMYGKELHTGLLFPIVDFNKIKYKISLSKTKNAVVKDNNIYFVKTDDKQYYDRMDYSISNCNNYNIDVWYSSNCKLFRSRYDDNNYLPIPSPTVYTLKPEFDVFENLEMFQTVLFKPELADKNEIDEYLNRFNGFMKKGLKKKFIERITTQYNKNIFNSEVEEYIPEPEVKKERIEKDKVTSKLENIEYLLMLLKQKNIEKYNIYIQEYTQIINSEDKSFTLTPLTIESLTILEGKIEYELNYSKRNANNILDLLHNLKTEYLENFQSKKEKTTKLTIADIDKLNESFLKMKSEYSVKDQLQIQKDIAFLYIMEIIEDDDIKSSDLEDSYFKDNLKYVMIVIMSLVDDDIIKDNIMINFETELDLYNIYNIIKDIEFKKAKQKIKQ